MKLELIGHDEKYALEQSLLTLFPGEKPVYGTVDKTADTRWARVTLTEDEIAGIISNIQGITGKGNTGTGTDTDGETPPTATTIPSPARSMKKKDSAVTPSASAFSARRRTCSASPPRGGA